MSGDHRSIRSALAAVLRALRKAASESVTFIGSPLLTRQSSSSVNFIVTLQIVRTLPSWVNNLWVVNIIYPKRSASSAICM